MSKKLEKIFIVTADLITINLAWVIFFYFRVQTGWFGLITEPEFILPMFAVYLYWFIIFLFVGMYKTWFAASRFDEVSTLFKASFVGIFILFFLIFLDDYEQPVPQANRFLIFYYWGFFLFLTSTGRLFVRYFQRRLLINGYGRKNALIVGFNPVAHDIHENINRYRALGLDIKGYLGVGENLPVCEYKGVKIIDSYHNVQKVVDETNAKEIIIALDKNEEDVVTEILAKCDCKEVGIKIVPDLYEIVSGQARTSQIYGFPLIDINPDLMPDWEKRAKRVLDIVVSLLFLVLTFPLILITSIAIKLDSKGTIFYKQKRSGMNGKEFEIYKFRSMRSDAEKMSGPVWSQKNDPRITRVGRLIRKVRIDEIPQMVNVLKGEMSLVGPRPERPYFVEKLSEEIPFYKKRLKVRPGITGWAQVKHKYDESIEDVKAKLRYDLFYIENMSIRMDLKILFRTIFVVLFGKGHFS